MERRLAAIFSADVQGSSRLMGDDEEATIRTLTAYREVMTDLVQQHRGRVVDAPGDNLLAEFASVVEAVQCAVEVQQALADRNAALPAYRQMAFRIGINLGDVVVEGERIYGDGVNITARVESVATGGGICISGTVYDQVENKLALGYVSLGAQRVKNIAKPVRIYRVQRASEADSAVTHTPDDRVRRHHRRRWRRRRWLSMVVPILIAVLAVVGTLLWNDARRPVLQSAKVSEAPQLPSQPDTPSLAVLPFDNFGNETEQEYFADGITDDLITDLSKVSGLSVIARNAVFGYKGQHVSAQQVAEELGVRYVLEGSVRRVGDAIRINAQLIDATTSHHVWADRYDRTYHDIFALQDEVTAKIVAALAVTLTDAERFQLARRPTANLAAYDLYLRAEHIRHNRTDNDDTGYRLALSLYEQAVALDPQFTAAHAGVAWVAYRLWRGNRWRVLPGNVARALADQALVRALASEPALPLAYIVQSKLHLVDGEYAAAITDANDAIVRDPSSADARHNLAGVLAKTGKLAEAEAAIETALRLNPKPGSAFQFQIGWMWFYVHQYERAIAHLKRATHARQTSVALGLAMNYAQLGQLAEAQATLGVFQKWWPAANYAYYRLQFRYFHPRVLKHFLDALRQAGMPEWPYGYGGGREALRLDTHEMQQVMFGHWGGSTKRGRAYTVTVSEAGRFVRRAYRADGTEVVMTGTASVEDGMFCLQSPQRMMGRKICGYAYRHPEGTPELHNAYVWVDVFSVWYFVAKQ